MTASDVDTCNEIHRLLGSSSIELSVATFAFTRRGHLGGCKKEGRRERLDFVGWWIRASRNLDHRSRTAAFVPRSRASCTTHDPEPTDRFDSVDGLAICRMLWYANK